jgi:hypothetical protein
MNSKNTVIPIYLLDATGDPFSILKCFWLTFVDQNRVNTG